MGSIILNKNNPKQEIKFNHEAPFVQITDIEILKLDKINDEKIASILFAKSLIVKYFLNSTRVETEHINQHDYHKLKDEVSIRKIPMGQVILDKSSIVKLEILFHFETDIEFELKINYSSFNQNINITNPSNNFKAHIDLNDNVKILFSAPFGQGKSTFLKYFFEQHEKEYEVFKVFPVNYSISHNEDVFKYIKTEILFQLLGKDVEFDKTDFTYFETFPSFFTKDPIRILAPLLKLIPKVGKTAHEVFQDLYKIANEYFDYHNQTRVDDEKLAKDFIEEMYKNEGSIFEDNFFTQLIRQQLEKLKIKNNKKNVLIIEDLDRMDPEHIFRILNVFAAHFDAPEYLEGYTNKFGFDKIIIVTDYKNIKNIFEHRYGSNTDFKGYINKYYSKFPFNYDNNNAILELSIEFKKKILPINNHVGMNILFIVFNDFLTLRIITLREFIKLSRFDLLGIFHKEYSIKNNFEKSNYRHFMFFRLLTVLLNVFEIETLINQINYCKSQKLFQNYVDYGKCAQLGLVSLLNEELKENGKGNVVLKENLFEFEYSKEADWDFNYEYYKISELKISRNGTDLGKNLRLDSSYFYEVLYINAKRFKEVGGFD